MATIDNTKAYRTHLEVLNGVFNLGYKGHQRSWAKIDDNSEVWFPTYHSGVVRAPAVCSEWTNIVDDKKGELREYWPTEHDDLPTRSQKVLRYVFGKDLDTKPLAYRFLGVYELTNATNRCYIYKKVQA